MRGTAGAAQVDSAADAGAEDGAASVNRWCARRCAMMAMPKAPATPEAKHIPSGCDAMVGCTTSAMIEPALLVAPRLSIEQSVVIWPSPHKPNDRSIAPEQEPPASLL